MFGAKKMINNLVGSVKQWHREWKDSRFLKRHGCNSWKEYNRKYDLDYNPRATRLKDFYHGYPYFYCFENHEHDVYYWDLGLNGAYFVDKWCRENCTGKYRFDFHRAIKAPWYDNEWSINEIGGGDYIFVAFKNEQDYLLFLLGWL
jgi:hypothetical protein